MSDPDAARRAAAQVLEQRRFREIRVPSVPKGPFVWIGKHVTRVTSAISRLLEGAGRNRFGWVLLIAVGLAVLVGLLVYVIRRRIATSNIGTELVGADSERNDPRVFEAQADVAEQAGAFADAVRFRFLAGLAHLERRGAIARSRRRTNRQVSFAMSDPSVKSQFETIRRHFEDIVHGHRNAYAADAVNSKQAWAVLLDTIGNKIGSTNGTAIANRAARETKRFPR